MTPKEKAEELVNTMLDKLYNDGSLSFKRILHARAIECAKVAADELIKQNDGVVGDFWNEVKNELKNM